MCSQHVVTPRLGGQSLHDGLVTWAQLTESLTTWRNSIRSLPLPAGGQVDITRLKAPDLSPQVGLPVISPRTEASHFSVNSGPVPKVHEFKDTPTVGEIPRICLPPRNYEHSPVKLFTLQHLVRNVSKEQSN